MVGLPVNESVEQTVDQEIQQQGNAGQQGQGGKHQVDLHAGIGMQHVESKTSTRSNPFADHGPEGTGAALVVTDAVNRVKLNEVNDCPAIVTVAGAKGQGLVRGDFSFWAELDNYPAVCEPVMLTGEDPFLLMFTSGTTGPAKPLLAPAAERLWMPSVGWPPRPTDSHILPSRGR